MSKTKKILIVAIVLVVLVALAGSVMVFAQANENDNDSEQSGARVSANQNRLFERLRQNWQGNIDYDALLADALDITVEALKDARIEANAAALEQAVEEGYITQRQVDLMTAIRIMRGAISRGELVADALRISIEELREAKENQALRELMAELDMTPAEVEEAVVVVFEDAVEQAVEDDLLTEEQANLIKNRPGLILGNPQAIQRRQLERGRMTARVQRGGRGRDFGVPAPFQGRNRAPARPSGF